MKKLLFAVIACVLCAGMIGGAFAYFTDVETSTDNNFTAGTLNIQIADVDDSYRDTPVSGTFSLSGLFPGQTFETPVVYLQNVGSITIERMYARFCNYSETNGTPAEFNDPENRADIGNKIILLSYFESNDGGAHFSEEVFDDANARAYETWWATHGASNITIDGVITLRELVAAADGGSGGNVMALCMFDGGNVPDDPPLRPGMTAAFKFKFQLPSTINNYYQGDIASFKVQFAASMDDTYPDPMLDDYITEDLYDLYAPGFTP